MAVYKEDKTGTWRVIYRYTDWTGEKKQTQKRGFKTKREAQAWEHEQFRKAASDLDMTFKSFIEQYTADMQTRIKENTWATKDHIIRTKLIPYFGKLKMCNITAQQIITWQNELLNYKDENGKPYSPVYLKTVHNQLSAIFNHAVRYYNLRDNPCKKAGSMGKKKNREMLFWTKEEYLKFADGEADYITTHIPMIIKWPGCAQNVVSHGFHYNLDLLPTLIDLLGGVPEFTGNRVVGKITPVQYDGESYADCVRTGADGGRNHLIVSQCAHVCQRSVRFGDWIYIRTYHDGYHLTEAEELFNVKDDPHETRNLAEEQPQICWHAAWYLEHWVAENMLSNIYKNHEDPLWNVIAEGGPFHCRGYLYDYCERLEQTGRADCAEELRHRHPQELKERY